MRASNVLAPFLAASLAVGLVYGLAELLILRYEQGDSLPPYSSLRTDPLGAKAFYESVQNLPSISATRNQKQLTKAESPRGKTLLFLGANDSDFAPDYSSMRGPFGRDSGELKDFAIAGGRVVIAFLPVNKEPQKRPRWNAENDETGTPTRGLFSPQKKHDRESEELSKARKADEEITSHSLVGGIGLRFAIKELRTDEDGNITPVAAKPAEGNVFTTGVICHTGLYFDKLDNNWKTIFARSSLPVIVERKLGLGSIVLLADSYPFSNEAMRKERDPELLAWLIGGNTDVVFDETHLGVESQPEVANLARRYRLHGLAVSLILLAALTIWSGAYSLLPKRDPDRLDSAVQMQLGRDSTTGLINLVRRSIPTGELISICMDEWRKSQSVGALQKPAARRVEEIVQSELNGLARARSPAAVYREIAEILHKRRS